MEPEGLPTIMGIQMITISFLVMRSELDRGARCGNSARRDLCGGCRVTGIPTVTGFLEFSLAAQIPDKSKLSAANLRWPLS